MGFKGEPAPEGSRLRQELVAQLTCDVLLGPSAPLYRKLYEQGLINGSFDGFYDAAPGCAHIMAGGESRDPHRVMEEIVKEAQRLVKGGGGRPAMGPLEAGSLWKYGSSAQLIGKYLHRPGPVLF